MLKEIAEGTRRAAVAERAAQSDELIERLRENRRAFDSPDRPYGRRLVEIRRDLERERRKNRWVAPGESAQTVLTELDQASRRLAELGHRDLRRMTSRTPRTRHAACAPPLPPPSLEPHLGPAGWRLEERK